MHYNHPLSRISVPLSGTFITNQPSQRIIKIFNVKTKTNFCVVRHNSLFCMISGRRLLTKRSRSIKLSSNRSSTYLGHTFFSEMNGLNQVHATRKKNTDCGLIVNHKSSKCITRDTLYITRERRELRAVLLPNPEDFPGSVIIQPLLSLLLYL